MIFNVRDDSLKFADVVIYHINQWRSHSVSTQCESTYETMASFASSILYFVSRTKANDHPMWAKNCVIVWFRMIVDRVQPIWKLAPTSYTYNCFISLTRLTQDVLSINIRHDSNNKFELSNNFPNGHLTFLIFWLLWLQNSWIDARIAAVRLF